MTERRRTPSLAHQQIIKGVEDIVAKLHGAFALAPTCHRLERPKRPLLGIYQPDFIWYVGQDRDEVGLIGEVEESRTASKSIVGACILADLFAKRLPRPCVVPLVFVTPNQQSSGFTSSLEERLNLASAYTKHVRVIPSMRAAPFFEWFEGFAVEQINRRMDDVGDELGEDEESDDGCL